MPQQQAASQIIEEVVAAVSHWKSLADRLGIPKAEQDRLAPAFDKGLG